ncbi:TetR family transcriptional regulator C-terminal domain-containing protein [Microbacterium sp.]|uniref:TetR family transcriptional regulator C-terminal domain-containing protein n=1 Tax=Microbacterium sp. TaxID=51671 RepID=UPI00273309BB|nr:TetR/AcrR family transcriptional regulator [Microbacterium sp.]MDP3949745.1 TetR/AcrR family transcriptional regulator [Microbacterium sp.]
MAQKVIQDGRRARGDATRRVVLSSATDLASVEGLDGLTIGRLAGSSGHSKSSIATLFGSKERLQLATIAAAREIFVDRIIVPARDEPRGLSRLVALLRHALIYSRDRVFPGGCFFAATAADVDSKPGEVSDAIRSATSAWYAYIDAQIARAIEADELTVDEAGAELLAFHLIALYEEANSRSLLMRDDRPYALAAAAMTERLIAAGAPSDLVVALDS